MKKKLKTKWVKALRSGKYKKGVGVLLSINGKKQSYCCLGVLGDICGFNEGGLYNCSYLSDIHPRKTAKFFSEKIEEKLSMMNDGNNGYKKHSFKQIAKWIEENIEED